MCVFCFYLFICSYVCVPLSVLFPCHGSLMKLAAHDFSAGLQTESACNTSLFGPWDAISTTVTDTHCHTGFWHRCSMPDLSSYTSTEPSLKPIAVL